MPVPSDTPVGRVLIACYHFPPDAAVGALRTARFARLLPMFGWQPYVLTVRDDGLDEVDPERLRGLEHVTVIRAQEFPVIRGLLLSLKNALGRPAVDVRRTAIEGTEGGSAREGLRDKVIRHVVSLAVFMPDGQKEWAAVAAFRSLRLVRRHRIACVLTSGPPASVHLIGLVSRLFTKARWIADFRDPWVESLEARPRQARSSTGDAVEALMERTVVRRADRIVTTTPRLKEALEIRYSTLIAGKVVCVPNAVDSRALGGRVEAKYDCLTITYTGTLYEGRSPEPLFRAVAELIRSKKLAATDVRIKLIGHCRSIDGRDTRAVADQYALGSVVEIMDSIPYSDALRVMRQSHLLLVIAPAQHRLIVPAKIYDYLAVDGEILALAEPGATTDIVTETASGRCFAPSDVEGIKDHLLDVAQRRNVKPGRVHGATAQYGDEYLTGRLAGELSSLLPS